MRFQKVVQRIVHLDNVDQVGSAFSIFFSPLLASNLFQKMLKESYNDTPKRQKLEYASDSSSYEIEPPNYYSAMVGEISHTSHLYKSICQEFWNKGKESKITQELIFINERMAVLYCLKSLMIKEQCSRILQADGHDPNEWIFLDIEYLKVCLEEMNAICERERFGTCFRVERETTVSICPPAKLLPFLLYNNYQ